jgi:hypothetical protein
MPGMSASEQAVEQLDEALAEHGRPNRHLAATLGAS